MKQEGYKPIEYAPIPLDFDQTAQYVMQAAPIDKEDHIYVGVEVYNLELDGEVFENEPPHDGEF